LPRKKKEEKPEVAEEEEESLQQILLFNPSSDDSLPKIRMISLYGEVDEEKAGDTCFSMMTLKEMGRQETLVDPDNPDSEITTSFEPFEFNISTYGGSALEMFSIYDVMRMIRSECEIHTFGLGKVMSAGVLLLAAGTKGKRKIGQNCRVMLHSVIGASHGALYSLENEMEEIRFLQDQHINCLVKETDMTRAYLKKLINRKVNVYLTAEEAVELGIADEVV
tara:strand:+ start:242 stop:907 length:666 start_codon:yes stop_codon:yes gene_type:complete